MTIPPQAEAGQWIEPPSAAPGGGDAWSFFDRIYCISLRSREDRRSAVKAEFARAGLADRVTFFLTDKHPTNSEQGIYESHQACLRAGLAAGAERIAVFEDDVVIRHFKPDRLREATAFLSNGLNWRAFFFGCYVRSSSSTACRSVRSIRYRCTAHGYSVTRAFAEQLVALPWQGTAWDVLLRELDDGRYYVAYPGFAFQSSSATDNDQRRQLDRVRRLFGGMHFGQRWDEFSHRRWRSMIVMHILSILLIIAVVMWFRSGK